MLHIFRKMVLTALTAALAVAGLQFFSVSASGAEDPSVPPGHELTNERLERLWARQLRAYERMGRSEDFAEKVQSLIDRAGANGKDVSAVQAALDAFEEAIKDARPIYVTANRIVNPHQGFDSNGKVTDPEKARETVRQMSEKLEEIREAMNGAGQALREAIQAFREANPRPGNTTTR